MANCSNKDFPLNFRHKFMGDHLYGEQIFPGPLSVCPCLLDQQDMAKCSFAQTSNYLEIQYRLSWVICNTTNGKYISKSCIYTSNSIIIIIVIIIIIIIIIKKTALQNTYMFKL